MVKFLQVTDRENAQVAERLAREIWTEHYSSFLSALQIEYMLQKFQTADAVLAQIEEGYFYYLALWQEQFCGYFAFKKEQDSLFVSKFYVVKEFRGRGVFGKMLAFAQDYAKAQGLNSIYLSVNKGNTASISVYLKKGFVKQQAKLTDIGNGYFMDDFVMVKKL